MLEFLIGAAFGAMAFSSSTTKIIERVETSDKIEESISRQELVDRELKSSKKIQFLCDQHIERLNAAWREARAEYVGSVQQLMVDTTYSSMITEAIRDCKREA